VVKGEAQSWGVTLYNHSADGMRVAPKTRHLVMIE